MKSLAEIQYDIRTARMWLMSAEASLDWTDGGQSRIGVERTATFALDKAKAQLQKALPHVREAITDLDGLVQDRKNKADGIDPEYEAAMADRPAECPECGDPYCPVIRGG